MRRSLAGVLVSVVVAAVTVMSVPPAGGTAGFGDVLPDRFFEAGVQWMVDNEITTGTSPTCFSPDDPVTRGQAAAFLWRMEGFPVPGPVHPFDDVVAVWQQDPVSWMFNNTITTGTSPSTYSPDDTLTRGQMAALLHRAAGEPAAAVTTFPDVFKDWQLVPVGWMEAEGITTGTSPTTFSPEDPVTRGQFAAFSYRWKGSPVVEIDPIGRLCVRITGAGTGFGETEEETVEFTLTATGGETIPTEEIPATGSIEIKTIVTFAAQWSVQGTVICIRDLSPFPNASGDGVWEVRFRAIASTNPAIPVGKHASFYVKDDPAGDSVGLLDPDISWDDVTCGPRGGIVLRPLHAGDVTVAVGCQPLNSPSCVTASPGPLPVP